MSPNSSQWHRRTSDRRSPSPGSCQSSGPVALGGLGHIVGNDVERGDELIVRHLLDAPTNGRQNSCDGVRVARADMAADGPYCPPMAEPLSADVVRHVSSLARLEVTEEEVMQLTEQLGAILRHADDVAALDIADVPPATHAIPLTNVFRKDEPRPGLERDVVLAQAPQAEAGRFRVPRLLGEQS